VIPLLLPGLLLTVILAVAFAGPVGRWLQVRPWVASLLLVGFGLVLAATLTPTAGAFYDGVPSDGVCDLSRIGIAPIRELVRPTEASLNVVLFLPLGVAVGLLPRSRRALVVTIGAFLLTFIVEGIQLLVPALGRGCQSADLVDNLMGLVLGTAIGLVLRAIALRRGVGASA
jgi:hypothetical protein